jgi:hypothetical protein
MFCITTYDFYISKEKSSEEKELFQKKYIKYPLRR